MTKTEQIKRVLDRNTKAMSLRPASGMGTAVTRITMQDGLTCQVEEGPWKLTVAISPNMGGDDRGPNPGILGRAALGTCLAMSYKMWAARRGVPITSLSVEVQADYDARGMLCSNEVPAGYTEVRYVVSIESEAAESEVIELLDKADAHSSYLDVFARPHTMRREIRYQAAGG